jgi:hypothetical protein
MPATARNLQRPASPSAAAVINPTKFDAKPNLATSQDQNAAA